MREPPEPRKSKSNILPFCILRLQRLLQCHKLKRKWHTHTLKKGQFAKDTVPLRGAQANTTNVALHGRHGPYIATPTSGVRVEDTFNVPTDLLPKSSKYKPLLLVSFPHGCDRSPVLKYLKKSKLSRRLVTKKKYRLKHFNTGVLGRRLRNRRLERDYSGNNHNSKTVCGPIHLEDTQEKENQNGEEQESISTFPNASSNQQLNMVKKDTLECIKTVRILKDHIASNADIRVIFHDKNVIKRTNLGGKGEFTTEKLKLGTLVKMEEYRNLLKRKSVRTGGHKVETSTLVQERKLKVYRYHESLLISHSAEC